MRQFLNSVTTFLKSDDGPTSVEYCVMMAFIFLVCFAAIGEIGATTHELYTESLKEIQK
ncbi:MAG: pilus assembly protein Flp/PilA [Porticoccaceae bacterium]|jgi:pilus assembly protein Flp/PilA